METHGPSRGHKRLALMAVAAAATMSSSACGTSPGSSRVVTDSRQPTLPLIGLPAVSHPIRWQAIDHGRLRLWLPPRWQADAGLDGCSITVYEDRVTLEPPSDGCSARVTTELTVRPSIAPAGPTGWRSSTINGVAVWSHVSFGTTTFAVPGLGVRVTATGSRALAVARTLGPSSLDAVMRMTGPVAVPSSWRAVRFDGFNIDVPRTWGISKVSADCGTLFSGTPSVYEDRPSFIASCPAVLPISLLQPGDGIWLQGVAGQRSTPAAYRLTFDHLGVDLSPAESVMGGQGGVPVANLTVVANGHALQGQIGLGADPAVAEEILSSLRYLGASAPNTPVDTTVPTGTTSVVDNGAPPTTVTAPVASRPNA